MRQPVSFSVAVSLAEIALSLDDASQAAGRESAARLGLELAGDDVIFHRVLLPQNAEYNYSGTLGGSDDSFKFATFPGLENDTSGDPILDGLGQPLVFSEISAVAYGIKPIRPIAGVKATALLTASANPAVGTTITAGSTVYTIASALTTADQVIRAATAALTLANVKNAINNVASAGHNAAAVNPSATATTGTVGDSLVVTAHVYGETGNAIPVATTSPDLAWTDAVPAPTTTLADGSDFSNPPTARGLEGTVRVALLGGLLPGTVTNVGLHEQTAASSKLFVYAGERWTPDAGASVVVTFGSDLPPPADAPDVNAVVTLIIIGKAA